MLDTNDFSYIFLLAVWLMNLVEIIKGEWFYPNWISILFWNFIGFLAFLAIILHYKNQIKELTKNKNKNKK